MAYLTPTELAEIVGEAELAAAAPPANDLDKWDADAVRDALLAASALVDARLRVRYAVPLDPVPDFLRRVTARLAHYELVGEGAESDLIRDRRRTAQKTLERVARGELLIGAARTTAGRARLAPATGRTDLRGLV